MGGEYLFRPGEQDRGKAEREITVMMVEKMRRAGVDPALIYAFYKCGIIVTKKNKRKFSPAELKEWEEAIEEHKKGKGEIPF